MTGPAAMSGATDRLGGIMAGLTAKQEVFAVAYAKGATGADAYRASYSTR